MLRVEDASRAARATLDSLVAFAGGRLRRDTEGGLLFRREERAASSTTANAAANSASAASGHSGGGSDAACEAEVAATRGTAAHVRASYATDAASRSDALRPHLHGRQRLANALPQLPILQRHGLVLLVLHGHLRRDAHWLGLTKGRWQAHPRLCHARNSRPRLRHPRLRHPRLLSIGVGADLGSGHVKCGGVGVGSHL